MNRRSSLHAEVPGEVRSRCSVGVDVGAGRRAGPRLGEHQGHLATLVTAGRDTRTRIRPAGPSVSRVPGLPRRGSPVRLGLRDRLGRPHTAPRSRSGARRSSSPVAEPAARADHANLGPDTHRRQDEEEHHVCPREDRRRARTEFGKGAARRIRRDDKIPAVIYGHGNDPIHVILPGHQTMMALKHGGANALLALDIDGSEQLALTKDVQIDPIRRVIEHLDFVAVTAARRSPSTSRSTLVGEAAPDTLVVTENSVVSVEAEATHIPEFFEVAIEGAAVGTLIHAKDLDLPSGSRCSPTPSCSSST